MTLGGHVGGEGDKAHAQSIAESFASGQVVANQVAVLPPGVERDAKTVTADLDKGIEQNLDAALIQNTLHDDVKYGVTIHADTTEVTGLREHHHGPATAEHQ